MTPAGVIAAGSAEIAEPHGTALAKAASFASRPGRSDAAGSAEIAEPHGTALAKAASFASRQGEVMQQVPLKSPQAISAHE